MSRDEELVSLIRQIQALAFEVTEQEKRENSGGELEAKKRSLEQLRWRLAVASKRTAHDTLGDAA